MSKQSNNYAVMKEFLSANKKNFSSGRVSDNFFIEYYVERELRFKGNEKISFQVQHPEFNEDIVIHNLDTDIYHTGFIAKYLEYKYDQKNNILKIINAKSTPKHGPYKILIHGDYEE
ncbi:hypothetical protein [Aliarcobacter butzleri]|uniref:hypothetical protein n=1 Tax=Aliarcobacter butzleri TaxID=28197 RepID=UPI003AF593C0